MKIRQNYGDSLSIETMTGGGLHVAVLTLYQGYRSSDLRPEVFAAVINYRQSLQCTETVKFTDVSE
jgi:hypothetical protein